MTEDKAMRERANALYNKLMLSTENQIVAEDDRKLIASEFLAISKAAYQRGMEEAAGMVRARHGKSARGVSPRPYAMGWDGACETLANEIAAKTESKP
jgi:hypothetical protein